MDDEFRADGAAQKNGADQAGAAGDGGLNWKVFGVLLFAAMVGVWAVLPYSFSLQDLSAPLPVPFWLLLVLGTLQNLILFALVTGLGLWLGGKVGLGAPLLRALLARQPDAPRQFRRSLPWAVGAGLTVGALTLVLEVFVFAPVLPEMLRRSAGPAAWQGFLASLYGGINEELLMRLGGMTLVAWIGSRLFPAPELRPGVMWIANLLAALSFGLGHLPALGVLVPVTPVLVARSLALNGVAGVVFGWLYWRRGLLMAMIAHFSADIVLHVIGVLLV